MGACSAFAAYFDVAPADHALYSLALHRLELCQAHSSPLRSGILLEPLEVRPLLGAGTAPTFELTDDGGRWVPVPWVLRSRHDRKSGFKGSMFLHPMQDRAWFASDRDGSGDTDLFEVEVLPDGSYGPVNRLPEPINSPYNERTPCFDAQTGRLYWSSNRTPSWGGLDVFHANLTASDTVVEHVPFAINSAGDESHFTPSGDGWTAWVVTRRPSLTTQAAIRVVLDGPVRHPVEVVLHWEEAGGPGMRLAVWAVESQRLLWEGAVSAEDEGAAWTCWDGQTLRALTSDSSGIAYSWTEWSIPASAAPVRRAYTWRSWDEPPVPAGVEAWEGPVHLKPEWADWPQNSEASALPTGPVCGMDLPASWRGLEHSAWWLSATVQERWVAVRALQLAEEAPPVPSPPGEQGWGGVPAALAWSPVSWAPIIDRLSATTQALDVICSAVSSDGWEDVCELWSRNIMRDQRMLEQVVVWNQIAEAVSGFYRLHEELPQSMRDELKRVGWYADAESVMDRSLQLAWATSSWSPLLGTEEVWRDWLWATWQVYKSRADDVSESAAVQCAWWDVEQAFEQPVWGNLTSSAQSLANAVLGARIKLPEAVRKQVPDSSVVDAPPVQDGSRERLPLPAEVAAGVEEAGVSDSVYTVQLGAFKDAPNGWAFWTDRFGLSQLSSNDWNKVVYGRWSDADSAVLACAQFARSAAFRDAFVVSIAVGDWERYAPWSDLRLAGYGMHLRGDSALASALLAAFPKLAHVRWHTDECEVLVGPIWSAPKALSTMGAWQSKAAFAEVVEFPSGLPQVHALEPVQSERAGASSAGGMGVAPQGTDGSTWVIRIAEYPLGAPAETRAVLLGLPAEFRVRAMPWGSGDAYSTGEFRGEEAAMKALEFLRARGFASARLIHVNVN